MHHFEGIHAYMLGKVLAGADSLLHGALFVSDSPFYPNCNDFASR